MKNIVRMSINRDLHTWFKSQEGETNDERMANIALKVNGEQQMFHYISELICEKIEQQSTIKYLASALVVSISISCLAVGYVAWLQGWF